MHMKPAEILHYGKTINWEGFLFTPLQVVALFAQGYFAFWSKISWVEPKQTVQIKVFVICMAEENKNKIFVLGVSKPCEIHKLK